MVIVDLLNHMVQYYRTNICTVTLHSMHLQIHVTWSLLDIQLDVPQAYTPWDEDEFSHLDSSNNSDTTK